LGAAIRRGGGCGAEMHTAIASRRTRCRRAPRLRSSAGGRRDSRVDRVQWITQTRDFAVTDVQGLNDIEQHSSVAAKRALICALFFIAPSPAAARRFFAGASGTDCGTRPPNGEARDESNHRKTGLFAIAERRAGVLAEEMTTYANRSDVLVLGLPRGGGPSDRSGRRARCTARRFCRRKLGGGGPWIRGVGDGCGCYRCAVLVLTINSLNVWASPSIHRCGRGRRGRASAE